MTPILFNHWCNHKSAVFIITYVTSSYSTTKRWVSGGKIFSPIVISSFLNHGDPLPWDDQEMDWSLKRIETSAPNTEEFSKIPGELHHWRRHTCHPHGWRWQGCCHPESVKDVVFQAWMSKIEVHLIKYGWLLRHPVPNWGPLEGSSLYWAVQVRLHFQLFSHLYPAMLSTVQCSALHVQEGRLAGVLAPCRPLKSCRSESCWPCRPCR